MKRMAIIAAREFLETVKTRAFLIGVVLMPGLITGVIFLMKPMMERAEREEIRPRRVAVVDQHGAVLAELKSQFEIQNARNPQRRFELVEADRSDTPETLAARVVSGDLYAYVIIPADAVDGAGACTLGRKDSQIAPMKFLTHALNEAIVAVRFRQSEPPIDRALVARLERDVTLSETDVASGAARRDDEMARLMTPFVFMFLLYTGTFGISMGLLTSLIEEKSSRVIELLLAAVSPAELMAGKILGTALVGLVTLGVWGVVGLGAARAVQVGHVVTGAKLVYAALYFLPAFLFYAALLAGVGSACSTLKEAQNMVSPMTIMNIIPILCWFTLTQYPASALAVTLSFIPPVTPFVMVLRLCADPGVPVWQIVATLALLWLMVPLTIWLSAKVFRTGVLMYGKAPSLRELARWVRQS